MCFDLLVERELVQDKAQLLGQADLRSEKACFISRIVVLYVLSDS